MLPDMYMGDGLMQIYLGLVSDNFVGNFRGEEEEEKGHPITGRYACQFADTMQIDVFYLKSDDKLLICT